MFSSDHQVASIAELLSELKKYVGLRTELLRLDFVSKLTVLLSVVLLAVVLMVLVAIVLLFLAFSLVETLAVCLDSRAIAYLVVSLAGGVLAGIVYLLRNRLIVRPVANFLGHLFLEPSEKSEEESL